MIDRYSRKVMRDVWTEENKFSAYLKVETLACYAWSEMGVIPREDVDKIRDNAKFSVERIKEIEEQTRHDVVAFTRAVSESLGEERKWVHYGLTSTDVVDTANGYLLKQADALLLKDLEEFLEVLRRRALEFKQTPCIGRTHGIHADITSFGLKWALWYEEMKRNIERFKYACKGVEAGKMSGAVGNFANIPPFIQDYVCENLGIASADISTQVLQRDAAQAQPYQQREYMRLCQGNEGLHVRILRKRCPVAREGHLPLQHRAHHPPGCHRAPGLYADQIQGYTRESGGLP